MLLAFRTSLKLITIREQPLFVVSNNILTAFIIISELLVIVFFFFLGPDGAHLNVSWRPKVIDPDKSIQLYFDITNRKIYFMQMSCVWGGGGACVC